MPIKTVDPYGKSSPDFSLKLDDRIRAHVFALHMLAYYVR